MAGASLNVTESKDKKSSYFSFGDDEAPVTLPYIPSWLKQTQVMYSKLPMLYAPTGTITLFTTGLCEKLHFTPSDLEFDSSANEFFLEYKSLHDPHLKNLYTHARTVRRLIKQGFITPELKVKCSLEEFNIYHQYLKKMRLNRQTQKHKRQMDHDKAKKLTTERKMKERRSLSERDKRGKEARERKKTKAKEDHESLLRYLKKDELKRVKLLNERRVKRGIEEAQKSRRLEQRKLANVASDFEERRRKATILQKRSEKEKSCTGRLAEQREMKKREREKKLAAHWSKHERLRRQQMKAQAKKDEKTKKEKQLQIIKRKEIANKTLLRHQAVFLKICNERANHRQEKESQIDRALSAKLRRVSDKFERRKNLSSKSAGERQGMFPPIKNKGIKTAGFRDTMWGIESVLQDSSLSDDLCNYAQAKRTEKTKSQSSVTSSSAMTSSTFLPPISMTSDTSEPQDCSVESGVTKLDIATEDISCLLDYPIDDSIVAAEVPLEGSIIESSGPIDGSLYIASLCMSTVDEESLIDPCETVAKGLVAGVFEEIAAENPEMVDDNNEGDVFAPDELYLDLIASYNGMNIHEDRLLSNNRLTINPSRCNEVDVLFLQREETDTTEASVDLNIYQTAEKVVRGVLLGAFMYLKTTEELAHNPSMSSLHVEGESGTQRSSASSYQTTDPLMVGNPSHSIGEQIAEIESVTELLNRLPSSAAQLRRSSMAVTGPKPTSTLSSLVTNSRSITDADTDIEEEDESVQEEIIGIVENEVIAQEKSRSSLASYANLTEVYRENPDGSLLVEGGISERALEGPVKSMTESVLSIESLHITGSEERGSTSSLQLNKSAAEEDAEGSGEATGIQYQSVIPVYHNSLVEISNELISQNLSAISNKPDVCSKFSVAHQASGKNSFRNVFRPDITYCEKSLQSIKQSIHQQNEDLGFLEEEEEFSEHSSKEKLITVEETEGVCYLPKEKAYQVHYESPTSQASIVVRQNSEQEKMARSCESSNSSDISPENKRGRRRKMKKRKHRKQSHAASSKASSLGETVDCGSSSVSTAREDSLCEQRPTSKHGKPQQAIRKASSNSEGNGHPLSTDGTGTSDKAVITSQASSQKKMESSKSKDSLKRSVMAVIEGLLPSEENCRDDLEKRTAPTSSAFLDGCVASRGNTVDGSDSQTEQQMKSEEQQKLSGEDDKIVEEVDCRTTIIDEGKTVLMGHEEEREWEKAEDGELVTASGNVPTVAAEEPTENSVHEISIEAGTEEDTISGETVATPEQNDTQDRSATEVILDQQASSVGEDATHLNETEVAKDDQTVELLTGDLRATAQSSSTILEAKKSSSTALSSSPAVLPPKTSSCSKESKRASRHSKASLSSSRETPVTLSKDIETTKITVSSSASMPIKSSRADSVTISSPYSASISSVRIPGKSSSSKRIESGTHSPSGTVQHGKTSVSVRSPRVSSDSVSDRKSSSSVKQCKVSSTSVGSHGKPSSNVKSSHHGTHHRSSSSVRTSDRSSTSVGSHGKSSSSVRPHHKTTERTSSFTIPDASSHHGTRKRSSSNVQSPDASTTSVGSHRKSSTSVKSSSHHGTNKMSSSNVQSPDASSTSIGSHRMSSTSVKSSHHGTNKMSSSNVQSPDASTTSVGSHRKSSTSVKSSHHGTNKMSSSNVQSPEASSTSVGSHRMSSTSVKSSSDHGTHRKSSSNLGTPDGMSASVETQKMSSSSVRSSRTSSSHQHKRSSANVDTPNKSSTSVGSNKNLSSSSCSSRRSSSKHSSDKKSVSSELKDQQLEQIGSSNAICSDVTSSVHVGERASYPECISSATVKLASRNHEEFRSSPSLPSEVTTVGSGAHSKTTSSRRSSSTHHRRIPHLDEDQMMKEKEGSHLTKSGISVEGKKSSDHADVRPSREKRSFHEESAVRINSSTKTRVTEVPSNEKTVPQNSNKDISTEAVLEEDQNEVSNSSLAKLSSEDKASEKEDIEPFDLENPENSSMNLKPADRQAGSEMAMVAPHEGTNDKVGSLSNPEVNRSSHDRKIPISSKTSSFVYISLSELPATSNQTEELAQPPQRDESDDCLSSFVVINMDEMKEEEETESMENFETQGNIKSETSSQQMPQCASPVLSKHASHHTSKQASPVVSQPGSPVASKNVTPVASQHASKRASPLSSQPGSPVASKNTSPVASHHASQGSSKRASPLSSQPGSAVASKNASPVASQHASQGSSKRASPLSSQPGSPVESKNTSPVASQHASQGSSKRASPLSSQCASPVASHHASQKSSGYSSPMVSHRSSEQTFKDPASETEDGIAVEPPNQGADSQSRKGSKLSSIFSFFKRGSVTQSRSEVASPTARDVKVAKRSASEGVKISHSNSLSTADVQTGPVVDKDAASKTHSETDPRHLKSTTDKPPSGKSSSSVLNIRPSHESDSTEHNQGETGPQGKETSSASGSPTKTPSSHSRTSTSSQHSASSKTSSGSGKSSSSSRKSRLSGKHSRKSSRASAYIVEGE